MFHEFQTWQGQLTLYVGFRPAGLHRQSNGSPQTTATLVLNSCDPIGTRYVPGDERVSEEAGHGTRNFLSMVEAHLREVTLNDNELFMAGMVGVRRRVESIKRRLTGTTTVNAAGKLRSDVSWDNEIEGVAGEIAAAKALGLFWGFDVNTFKDPDVGPYQVRTTDSPKKSLIVRPKDSSDEVYIFVAGRSPHFTIVGWIFGHEAKQEEFWGIRGSCGSPAWWIPPTRLHPMDTLPSVEEAHYARTRDTRELYSAA